MEEDILAKIFENDQTGVAVLKASNHEFCREKGIKREYSVARTPQQNGVAERKNRTLIEAARTMLADSKLPTTFWAEAVSTACYVQNRVLIVKPHNKTPYELFRGIKPAIGFMKPFGCHVTILNTLDKLGKFDGKSDEGKQGVSESSTSSQQDQDCIVMPIWKDASYFDDASLKSVVDAQKIQIKMGTHDDCVSRTNGTDDQQLIMQSRVNTGSRELVLLSSVQTRDVKSASTPTDLERPLVKDADVDDVSPKTSHLLAVKRIFRYLKGKPSLGLWYSKDSLLELITYTDSDYAGATLDRKSTTGGCQFLGNRLISWQCKKQTVVATSTTEAEYVAAANCCGQVLWIQNQLLDYGYNFMNTVIYIDNTSTICIIENPVQHSKTKHIEIRHHFIRDCNAKKLIQMAKIDTQLNVADLLTKGFDAGRFQYLVSSIGMLNP
ncbi:putative ribonuclease H-like domain-containing protein [Tanacetum coccineum]